MIFIVREMVKRDPVFDLFYKGCWINWDNQNAAKVSRNILWQRDFC